MTKELYDKRILESVADMRTILDSLAEEHILPSGTLEKTRVERRKFKREVARILLIAYTPKDRAAVVDRECDPRG